MDLLKVENMTGLARDKNSGAVLNINTSAIQQARKAKEKRKQDREEIESLKQDVNDIKLMLTQILEKL